MAVKPGAPEGIDQSTLDSRREQMFPKLAPAEIARIRRFGETRRYAAGDLLFVTGEVAPGMFVIVSGTVAVKRRDPLGRLAPIVEQGPGGFVAEVGQLSGQPALVDVQALGGVQALLIPSKDLRSLMIAETDLGDRIMRALILRRVALIEIGAGGPVLIGPALSGDVMRLEAFLARNAYPHQILDPAEDRDAAALVEYSGAKSDDLPLVVCPKGAVLKNPREAELARSLDMVRIDQPDRVFDVAIVGAGPGGLSTAVYAASEGLSVIVFDAVAFGGQAGGSARIENYLGFPTGIPGLDLTGRAFVQAQKFGASLVIPAEIARLDRSEDGCYGLHLTDGTRITARTVVIASGARYRKPDIPHLEDFEGRGVWYWSSPIEARLCRREEIVVVGGGNSAGQAVVYLRDFAAKIWMLVRGTSLDAGMSRYLVDRINGIKNIEVLTGTEIVALSGTPERQIERVRWRHKPTGQETEKPIRHVFIMIGADPATAWLKDCGVALDPKQFIRTGPDSRADEPRSARSPARPLPLETNLPGVFAVGDVRAGSVKRVGAAIGEGAAVVAELHAVLADPPIVTRGR